MVSNIVKGYDYQKRLGFTLVELLIVITIIAILVVVSSIGYKASINRAGDARSISGVKEVQKALELYYDGDGDGEYPNSLDALVNDTNTVKYFSNNKLPKDYNSEEDFLYQSNGSEYSLCTRQLIEGKETGNSRVIGLDNGGGSYDNHDLDYDLFDPDNIDYSNTIKDFFCVESQQ